MPRRNQHFQGTGELGVELPEYVEEHNYKAVWSESDLIALSELIGEQYQIGKVKIVFPSRAGIVNRWGTYYHHKREIKMYSRYPSTIIHEMSHAVTRVKFPSSKSHGKEFYQVCSDVWSRVGELIKDY